MMPLAKYLDGIKRFWSLIVGVFVIGYPIVVSFFNTQEILQSILFTIGTSFKFGPVYLSNQNIYWPAILFLIVTSLWIGVFRWLEHLKDNAAKQESSFLNIQITELKNQIASINTNVDGALNNAPVSFKFDSVPSYLREVNVIFVKLRSNHQALNQNAVSIVDHVSFLTSQFRAIKMLIAGFASDYFGKPNIKFGVNIMIFFSNENKKLIKSLIERYGEENAKYFFRDNYENNLEGVLLLIPQMVVPIGHKIPEVTKLIMPIYSKERTEIYCEREVALEHATLRGAIYAYRFGSDVIGNTRAVEEYWKHFNIETKTEIGDFFKGDGLGKSISSFASFRIPDLYPKNDYGCIGVVNIDSPMLDSFGNKQKFIDVFYALIYPMLMPMKEYITYYRRLLIEDLQHSQKRGKNRSGGG